MLNTLPSLLCAPFPFTIYACLSAKEWDDIKDDVGAKYDDWIGSDCIACAREIGGGSIVCINADEEVDLPQLAGIVAHECQHSIQSLWKHIGESNPSPELEAYTIQSMVTFIHSQIILRQEKVTGKDDEMATGTQ